MDIVTIVFFITVGGVAGTAAGLLGIGGGIIYVPILLYFLEQKFSPGNLLPVVSVSTSLAIIMVSAINGVYGHWKNNNFIVYDFPYLLSGGLLGAIAASLILTILHSSQFILLLAIFQLVMGGNILFVSNGEDAIAQIVTRSKLRLGFIGFISGSVSSFFGVGGGIITVPLLHLWEKYPITKSIGASTGFMIFVSFISLSSYFLQGGYPLSYFPEILGTIYLPAFLAIVPSAFIFARFGANLASRINSRNLTRYFGILLILLALRTFGHTLWFWIAQN